MTKYQRVHSQKSNEEDIEDNTPSTTFGHHVKSALRTYILVLTGFCVGAFTSAVCMYPKHSVIELARQEYTTEFPFLIPPGNFSTDFSPNDTFWLWSPESDKAWRSIIPDGLGFVQHPEIGPEIVGLAFVHKLHCVDMLHQSYLKARKGLATNETNRHTTHCLEYLRQSVICNADPNIEYRQEDSEGILQTLGDGIHQCRNYDQIMEFAEEWRVFNGQVLAEKDRISEVENIPGRVINYDYVSSRGDKLPS